MTSNIDWARQMLGHNTNQRVVDTFYGQEDAKAQLMPFIQRDRTMPPILLLGEPGMGKTRLAWWMAYKRENRLEHLYAPIRDASGFPRVGEMVLIDEVHLLKKPEWLFSIMERRSHSILGATTKPRLLEPALKSRFVLQIHLKPYDAESLKQIITDQVDVDPENIGLYAGAAAGNPRQALRIAETVEIVGDKPSEVLAACRITADGITEFQIDYLTKLSGSPIGVSQLASILYSDEDSIRDAERYLINLGLVDLTTGGRKLSKKGQEYVEQLHN